MIVRHESGIDLLLAPPMPESAELVSNEQHHLLRIVEMLRTLYDYVVVDMDQRSTTTRSMSSAPPIGSSWS